MGKIKKVRRLARYNGYKDRHFLHYEALELSRLNRVDYHEVRLMVKQRKTLWSRFARETSGVTSSGLLHRLWVSRVLSWYKRHGYVPKDMDKDPDGRKWVWLWFDDVNSRVPEEVRYTTDHRGRWTDQDRQSRLDKANAEVARTLNARFINNLMRTAVREPWRDAELTEQARRLGFNGKSLKYTGTRRGIR